MGEAISSHRKLLAAYHAGRLSPDDLANGIEQETLPRWEEAEQKIERLRREGAQGKVFESLASYAQSRREAPLILSRAFREQDSQQQKMAITAWQEAGCQEAERRRRVQSQAAKR